MLPFGPESVDKTPKFVLIGKGIAMHKNIYLGIILGGFCTMNIFTIQNDLPSRSDQPNSESITLFAHGLLDDGETQAHERALVKAINSDKKTAQSADQIRHTIASKFVYFDFDDAFKPRYGIKFCKFWHLSFGQQNDIEKLKRAHADTIEQFPERPILGYGVSRGASVWISTMANHQLSNVNALILESPFDRIQTSLKAAAEHIPSDINLGLTRINSGFLRAWAEYIITTAARKYKVDAQQPIDVIKNIPPDRASLIVCSLEDKLVPAQSSYNNYQVLRDSGHKHAYVLVLEKGKHAKLLQGPNGDQYTYVAHAFCKKYGHPYHPLLAEKGKHLLELCQPNGPLAVTQPTPPLN